MTRFVAEVEALKKILMIAYHYYPDMQVGAQRTIKYVKYLPDYGWQPHVLTVDPKYYPQRDDSPLGYACPVFRTCKWPVPDDVYRKIKRSLTPSGSKPTGQRASEKTSNAPTPRESSSVSWLKKLLNSLSDTPDRYIGWYIPGLLAARRLIKEHGFDVIYTSGPPQTCHLIGYSAHRLTGIPWVADFRDPWLYPKQRDRLTLKFSKRFDVRYEARLARYASLVITTTDEWRDHLKQVYGPLLDTKCHSIVNGFDEDDFDDSTCWSDNSGSSTTRVLYAGNLYAGRDPSAMLIAGGELLAEGFFKPGEIVFEFYGNNDIDMEAMDRIISGYGLESMVSFRPPVPREAYLKHLQQANILVLIQAASGKVHIPAKAFEYLGTGNAILTLTTEGATKNFMSRFGHTAIAGLDNKDEIKAAFKKLFSQSRDGSVRSQRRQQLGGITKRNLTREFALLLDGLIVK